MNFYSKQIIHLKEEYKRLAPSYDRKWQGYLRATNDAALSLLNPSLDDVILDAAGGTGLLTDQISKFLGKNSKVILVDASKEMLRVAENRLRDLENMHLSLGDVHNLPFKPESFSKVVSVSSFHYFEYPQEALNEFYRVLKPEGYLIIVDWCTDKIYFKLFDMFFRRINRPYIKSYTLKELQDMLTNEGFAIDHANTWHYRFWPLMGLKARKLNQKLFKS